MNVKSVTAPSCPISVLVLTHNEEVNIQACLASVAWSDDVVVFDSFSTDRTCELARAAGARVVQHPFADYGSQREAARTQVAYKHPWLLMLDADERVEPELARELGALPAEGGPDAYRVRRKDHFMGRWIRRSTLYPSWFVRVLRHQRVRYEARSVHEYPLVEGPIGVLQGHLVHHNFSKGLTEWVARHNRYATLEAQENARSLMTGDRDWAGLCSLNPVRRRRALKLASLRLPFRPLLRFLYMYLLRGGCLDGRPGFWYCRLLAFYELLIVLKLREIVGGKDGQRG